MLMKECACGERSYSSYDRGAWICPCCGRDITEVEAAEADAGGTGPDRGYLLLLKTVNDLAWR